MKIKHWQGYGSLNAIVLQKQQSYGNGVATGRLVKLEVWGNHECGLELPFRDNYRLAQWLGKVGGFKEEEIESYTQESFYKNNIEKHVVEEHCYYTVALKDKRF